MTMKPARSRRRTSRLATPPRAALVARRAKTMVDRRAENARRNPRPAKVEIQGDVARRPRGQRRRRGAGREADRTSLRVPLPTHGFLRSAGVEAGFLDNSREINGQREFSCQHRENVLSLFYMKDSAELFKQLCTWSSGSQTVEPGADDIRSWELNFFIWIARNPLKSPEFGRRNPRESKPIFLDRLGLAWFGLGSARRNLVSQAHPRESVGPVAPGVGLSAGMGKA